MRHHERNRPARPDCEGLEHRQVLSAAPHLAANPIRVQQAEIRAAAQAELTKLRSDFRRMTADITRMQAASAVTPFEFASLKQDFDAISADPHATPAGLTDAEAHQTALDFASHIEFAFLSAYNSPAQWASRQSGIEADFATLGIQATPAHVDQLMSDLKAIALSADVAPNLHNQFVADFDDVTQDGQAMANPPLSMAPIPYLNGRIGGFARGGRFRGLAVHVNIPV